MASLGSATNLPDLAIWSELLAGLKLPLAAYHADPDGRQDAASLLGLLPRANVVPMPEGVKVAGFMRAGRQPGMEVWSYLGRRRGARKPARSGERRLQGERKRR